jgi:hypothetical protein
VRRNNYFNLSTPEFVPPPPQKTEEKQPDVIVMGLLLILKSLEKT